MTNNDLDTYNGIEIIDTITSSVGLDTSPPEDCEQDIDTNG